MRVYTPCNAVPRALLLPTQASLPLILIRYTHAVVPRSFTVAPSNERPGSKHTRQELPPDPPAWPWQTNESHGVCRCQGVGNEAARRSSRTLGLRVLPDPHGVVLRRPPSVFVVFSRRGQVISRCKREPWHFFVARYYLRIVRPWATCLVSVLWCYPC